MLGLRFLCCLSFREDMKAKLHDPEKLDWPQIAQPATLTASKARNPASLLHKIGMGRNAIKWVV